MTTTRNVVWHLLVVTHILRVTVATTTNANRHLMVNGIDTKPGEYPFHTQVGCCSGALIAPDVVLTAGHDVSPEAVGMVVTIGAYYSSVTALQPQGEPRTVTRSIRHPGYDAIHNDFCLLFLDGPAEIAPPIPINRSPTRPKPHQKVTLLGTGTFNLSTSVRSVVLQESSTWYIPNEKCSKAFDPQRGISYGGGFLDDTNLCTMGNGDGCAFDSGGPVLADGVLIGLISYGVDCNDPVYPAVNARVSAVHEWIDRMVCRYSKYPPADFVCSNQTTATPPPGSSSTSGDTTAILLGEMVGGLDYRFTKEGSHPQLTLVVLIVLLGFALLVMKFVDRPHVADAPGGIRNEERPLLLPTSKRYLGQVEQGPGQTTVQRAATTTRREQ
jgi:secreted trypsin-like serine protease